MIDAPSGQIQSGAIADCKRASVRDRDSTRYHIAALEDKAIALLTGDLKEVGHYRSPVEMEAALAVIQANDEPGRMMLIGDCECSAVDVHFRGRVWASLN